MKWIIRTTEDGIILSERVINVKAWHWGCILLLVAAYLVGVKYPSTGQTLLSKVGL